MRTFKNFPSSWVEVFFLPKLGSKQRWLLFAVKYSFLRIFLSCKVSDFCNFGGGGRGVRFTDWGNGLPMFAWFGNDQKCFPFLALE